MYTLSLRYMRTVESSLEIPSVHKFVDKSQTFWLIKRDDPTTLPHNRYTLAIVSIQAMLLI